MAIDTVCNMEVDESTAQWKTEHAGTTYYFCSPSCKSKFETDPGAYLRSHDHGGQNHNNCCPCVFG